MENEFRFFLNKEELLHGIRDCEHVGFFMYFFVTIRFPKLRYWNYYEDSKEGP